MAVVLIVSSCAVRTSFLQITSDKRLQQLDAQRENLKRATDPVGRTKTDIKISEILLSLVRDAVKSGDSEGVEQRLNQYVAAIRDAHETMMKTGRDAHRKPGGFKDLEIALRRQVRQLEDIGHGLTLDQREPVEKAMQEAADIRDSLLKALFGEQNAKPRKG